MQGPFNITYAITGKNPSDPKQPWSEDYMKALGTLIKILIIIAVIVIFAVGTIAIGKLVYSIFNPKKQVTQSTSTNIEGPTGSATQNIKYTVVQIGDKGKQPIRVVPYIDADMGYGNDTARFASSDWGWQVVGGIRLEFDGLWDQFFAGKKTMTQEVQSAVVAAETIKDPKLEIKPVTPVTGVTHVTPSK